MILFRESYKSAMNDIETNKELLNSLLEKADKINIPKKEKFTVIKKMRVYTLSGLATAAAVMIVAFNMNNYDKPTEDNAEESSVPRIASEETADAENLKMAAYDGVQMTRNMPMGKVKELTKDDYYSYIGIDIGKLKIPEDLKISSEDEINILEDESGEIINDYHTFSFKGNGERYVSISTAKTKETDADWFETVSDKNYSSIYSVKNGTAITVECYMIEETEQKALLDSFNN